MKHKKYLIVKPKTKDKPKQYFHGIKERDSTLLWVESIKYARVFISKDISEQVKKQLKIPKSYKIKTLEGEQNDYNNSMKSSR